MGRDFLQNLRDEAIKRFKEHGGVLRAQEALATGISPHILYELRDAHEVEELAPGLYGLPGLPEIEHPDFLTIAKKVPRGVVCLTTALYFYELTVQIPRKIDVALPQKMKAPKIAYPPVHFHWVSDHLFSSGIEIKKFRHFAVQMYSKEKTIVDCFRLRRKVTLPVAIEALKNYWKQGGTDLQLLTHYARESRVLRVMKPYIEAITIEDS